MVEPADSAVRFSVRHLGVKTTRGEFRIAGAGAVSDPQRGVSVEADIDAGSVDTHDRIRDTRLRDEFFDVEHHPRMRFVARAPAAGSRTITGELTIRGATRPVELAIRTEPVGEGAVRVRAKGELSRSEFGLEWGALVDAGKLLVGDRVQVEADVLARAA